MFAKGRIAAIALVVALLPAVVSSTAACGGAKLSAGSGPEIPLVNTFKSGDTWVQEMTTAVKGTTEGGEGAAATPAEQTTKTRITTTVQTAAADGGATLTVNYETLEMTVDGQPQDIAGRAPQEVTMTVDRTGRILSIQGASDGDAASMFLSGMPFNASDLSGEFSSPVFPADGAARVGEEWQSIGAIPLKGTGQNVSATTKGQLTAVSTEGSRQVATIRYTYTLPLDLDLDLGEVMGAMLGASAGDFKFVMAMDGDMAFTNSSKVDAATGRVISTTGGGTMALQMKIAEAPEEMIPKNKRGPFKVNVTIAISTVEEAQ